MKKRLSALIELIRKCLRFGPQIALGNVVQKIGRRCLAPSLLKRMAESRNRAIQARLMPLVDAVLKSDVALHHPCGAGQKDDCVVWLCWLQGEATMPPIPSLCLDSIRKYSSGAKVIVLTLDNFSKYVKIDDNILTEYRKGHIKNCHFADILRISILAQRGGLWLDATMLCVSPLCHNLLYDDFCTIKTIEQGLYVSRCRWAVYCLRASKGNRLFVLLERLFVEYIKTEFLFMDYFLFDQFISMLYEKDEEIRMMIDRVPKSNPNIFALADILHHKYSAQKWKSLCSKTDIFKLNWKKYTEAEIMNMAEDSLFAHIKHTLNDIDSNTPL